MYYSVTQLNAVNVVALAEYQRFPDPFTSSCSGLRKLWFLKWIGNFKARFLTKGRFLKFLPRSSKRGPRPSDEELIQVELWTDQLPVNVSPISAKVCSEVTCLQWTSTKDESILKLPKFWNHVATLQLDLIALQNVFEWNSNPGWRHNICSSKWAISQNTLYCSKAFLFSSAI